MSAFVHIQCLQPVGDFLRKRCPCLREWQDVSFWYWLIMAWSEKRTHCVLFDGRPIAAIVWRRVQTKSQVMHCDIHVHGGQWLVIDECFVDDPKHLADLWSFLVNEPGIDAVIWERRKVRGRFSIYPWSRFKRLIQIVDSRVKRAKPTPSNALTKPPKPNPWGYLKGLLHGQRC